MMSEGEGFGGEQEDLEKLLGDDPLQCPECEFRGSWKSETLRHLGSAHEKVEIFLEPKYRIPK